MSLIEYHRATYAADLRDRLESAGCERQVAAIVARAVADLIDHVASAESTRRREAVDSFVRVTLVVTTTAIAAGVLIAVFR